MIIKRKGSKDIDAWVVKPEHYDGNDISKYPSLQTAQFCAITLLRDKGMVSNVIDMIKARSLIRFKKVDKDTINITVRSKHHKCKYKCERFASMDHYNQLAYKSFSTIDSNDISALQTVLPF